MSFTTADPSTVEGVRYLLDPDGCRLNAALRAYKFAADTERERLAILQSPLSTFHDAQALTQARAMVSVAEERLLLALGFNGTRLREPRCLNQVTLADFDLTDPQLTRKYPLLIRLRHVPIKLLVFEALGPHGDFNREVLPFLRCHDFVTHTRSADSRDLTLRVFSEVRRIASHQKVSDDERDCLADRHLIQF